MTTVTISLPETLKDFLETEVQSKGYGNVSEYVRGLLRDAQRRENESRLEALLLEGLASGKDLPLNPEFWSRLQADAGRLRPPRSRSRKKTRSRKRRQS